jgi:hypothetical protein
MWFYQNDSGDDCGPHDLKRMQRWVSKGSLQPGTMVRQLDSAEWSTAEEAFGVAHGRATRQGSRRQADDIHLVAMQTGDEEGIEEEGTGIRINSPSFVQGLARGGQRIGRTSFHAATAVAKAGCDRKNAVKKSHTLERATKSRSIP